MKKKTNKTVIDFGTREPKERITERELNQEEYEVRDLTWAVGVKCKCGYELDLFTWNEPTERKCKVCGRQYEIRLKTYEVGL